MNQSPLNYVALLLVIIIGVISGTLISNWITAKFIEVEVQTTNAETSKEISKQTKKVEQKVKKQKEISKIQEFTSQEYLMKQRELDDI